MEAGIFASHGLFPQSINLIILTNTDQAKAQAVQSNPLTASEVRRESISGHAITLEALAYLGVELLQDNPDRLVWQVRLDQVDWCKANADWEGLFIFGGRIRKNKTTTQARGHLSESTCV